MIQEIVEAFLLAAAVEHLEEWTKIYAANRSIDFFEFAQPPEMPDSVKAAADLFWSTGSCPDCEGGGCNNCTLACPEN